MDSLESSRKEIDAIDQQLAELFARRMGQCAAIARYKHAHGLPVTDPVREETVLNEHTAYCRDECLQPYFKEVLETLMKVSKAYQTTLLKG